MGDHTDPSARLGSSHLARLVDTLGAVVWEFDRSTGAFTYVSAGAERLLGFPREQWLVPGFWVERLHPDDAEWAPQFCQQATDRREDHEFDYRLVHRNGSAVWIREVVTVDKEKGVDGRLTGIMVDITAEKLAENQVARQAERFEAVFSMIQDLYFLLDAEGRVLDFQAPGSDLLLAPPEVFIGKRLADALPPDLGRLVSRNLELCREAGTMVMTEYDAPGPLGQRTWEARFLPLDSGEIVVISRDITSHKDTTRQLAQSQERYKTLVEMSPFAIYVVSLAEKVLFCNLSALQMFGAAEGETLVGRSVAELVPEGRERDDAVLEGRRVAAGARSSSRGVQSATTPARCVRRTLDGRLIDVELSFAGMMFRGEPALLVLARDITEELVAERRIRESEERFRSVVEQSPVGMHVYEFIEDGLVLVAANAAADAAVHVAHDDLLGLPIEKAFPPTSGSRVPAAFKRIAIEGGAWHMDGFTYPVEGGAKVFDMNAFQVGTGRVAVSFQDVTERDVAAKALRESEQRLRDAQEIARIGSYVIDMRTDKWEHSPVLETLWGVGPDFPWDSQAWLELVHPDDRQQMADYVMNEVLGAGAPFDREYRVVRPDDLNVRWMHGLGEVKYDASGRPVELSGTIQDISDRKAAEEVERRHAERLAAMTTELTITEDRERRRLAETLHHRVSQALAVARMHLASATRDSSTVDPGEIGRAAAMLDSAISEARSVTTELAPPVLYELGLGPALRWQCDDLKKHFGLTVHLSADADESGTDADAKMVLFRAARELLVNIYKHAGTKEAWVSLDALPGWLALTVADKGRGFDPAAKRGDGDSGFGLFSIRERLPHLGGDFELESTPGGGTRVTVRIPRGGPLRDAWRQPFE